MAHTSEWTMNTTDNITFKLKIIDDYLYAESDTVSAYFAGKIPETMSAIILDKSKDNELKFHASYSKLIYSVIEIKSLCSYTTHSCILKEDPMKRAPNMNFEGMTQDQLLCSAACNAWQRLRIENHLQKIELTKEQEKNRTLKILLTNALNVANS